MSDSEAKIVDSLTEMGFARDKAEAAVKATDCQGVQLAMDWILNTGDHVSPGSISGPAVNKSLQPKCLKCEDCGKLLRTELEAQAHAARTSHQNFAESTEEIKPLTAEEKAAQLAKLEEKMQEQRRAREEREKKESKEREKVRRKTGKELTDIKQRMELTEAKKLAEERRKEKAEDHLARQRVKDQIARDHAEREACTRPPQVVQTQPKAVAATEVKTYDTCRLQIRLVDGTSVIKSFRATDNFEEVLSQVGAHNTSLRTTFPRKIFTAEDAGKTLEDLGLVPSAVLIQTLNKE